MKKENEIIINNEFKQLIKSEDLLPEVFFSRVYRTFEEIPLYSKLSQISFLSGLPTIDRDLYLLKYALKHLKTLIKYFCQNVDVQAIRNTLLFLVVQDWEWYPYEPFCPSFFVSFNRHNLFRSQRPFVHPYTDQSKYITKLLKKLNINDVLVCDELSGHSKDLQRVYVGFQTHPHPDLLTLGSFIKDEG